MDSETYWHLKNFNLLQALSDEELKRLQDMVNTDWIRRKDPVYLPGDPTEWVYFLKKGLVKLSMTAESGKSATVALLKPGEVFGELSQDESQRSSMEAITLKNSYLCRISRTGFNDFARRNKDLILSVNKLLGLRLRKIETAVYDMLFLDVPSRLAKLLYQLSLSDSIEIKNGRLITMPLTHQELGNLVGATREMVTNVLGRMEVEGLIGKDGRKLIIRDIRRLEAMSHGKGFQA
ncbi:Crp/Fnr family transcriptional regulator [bacterium]|nr:Crp/Fnr family transcriptional regulator [bacterium]